MTPERAAYHYLMLCVGLREAFDADFDAAVENEDPLSDLTVHLSAAPPSDHDACISVLMNYCADFTLDGRAVLQLVLSDLAERWHSGRLSPEELAHLCRNLSEEAEGPFSDLSGFGAIYYCWDDARREKITWDRFRECVEIFFQTGRCPSPKA